MVLVGVVLGRASWRLLGRLAPPRGGLCGRRGALDPVERSRGAPHGAFNSGERRPRAPNQTFDPVELGSGASDWTFDPVEHRSGDTVVLVGVVLGRAPRRLLGRFGLPWGASVAAEARSTQWNLVAAPPSGAFNLGERRPGAPNRMFDPVEHGFGASDWEFDPVEPRSGGPVVLVGVVLGRASRRLLGRFGPLWDE